MAPDDDDVFDVGDVSPMSYNFSKWLSHDNVQVAAGKREIPEPSTEQISKFGSDYARLQERIAHMLEDILEQAPTDADGNEIEESKDDRDARIERNIIAAEAFAITAEDERAAIFAGLCNDTPPADEMMRLPHRVRRSFQAYVTRKVTNPEA